MTWTAAARRRVVEAYRAGEPVSTIAAAHGRSESAIRGSLRRWGEPARSGRTSSKEATPPEVVEAAHDLAVVLVARHGSVRAVERATGISRSTVMHALHRHEVGVGTLERLRAALGRRAA